MNKWTSAMYSKMDSTIDMEIWELLKITRGLYLLQGSISVSTSDSEESDGMKSVSLSVSV